MIQPGRILAFTAIPLIVAFALTDSAFAQTQAPPVRSVARGRNLSAAGWGLVWRSGRCMVGLPTQK